MKKPTKFISSMLLLTASLIWGFSFVAVKNTLSVVQPNYILAFRFTAGAIALCYTALLYKKDFTPKNIFRGAIVGACMYLAFATQTIGLQYISSGKNALITALYVIVVPFLMWVVTKKAPSFRTIIAAVICFSGVVVLSLGSDVDTSSPKSAEIFGLVMSGRALELFGIVLTSISGILFALHIVLVASFPKECNVMSVTFLQFVFAALFAWIFASVCESFPTSGFSPSIIGGLCYICVLSTIVALTFQNIGVQNTPPALAAIILCLESLFGCIMGIIALKENVSLSVIVGAVLILSSVLVSKLKEQ